MTRRIAIILSLLLNFGVAHASLIVASGGRAKCILVQQQGATEPERHAVSELKLHLEAITGAQFEISNASNESPDHAIIIGQGALTAKLFPEISFSQLGPEEFVMRSKGQRLLLAGGRPRGTMYAVSRFLQDQCGVRWWTPWATNLPHHATLRIPQLDVRGKPAFEYRGAYWFPGFDPLWKTRNAGNNESQVIPADLGGCIQYKGFCHTFYPLVPPDKYFGEHPEWYSLLNGKRTHQRAQLCLTNPKLRDFMVERVKEWLRSSPDCEIISVTQNDWDGACECPDCKALDDAEGSHSGTMITFANYIAEEIEAEFPKVAVDTFAYTYSRKPPKTVRPRKNVIVRLCSIECNFREPLDHPSNAAFAVDIIKWSEICPRLYVWDYTTDFKHYIHPHPNWFTLGPNVRFFQAHGVKGLFEQGAYAGHGAEMAEMRAWVLEQLLWNPQQDDHKLIREFLQGYYGTEAAKFILEYFALVYAEAKDFYLACYLRKDPPPYLAYKTLGHAERLWQQAESAASGNPDYLARVKIAHLPIRYAFLRNWQLLSRECWEQNQLWPLSESRKEVANAFRAVCEGVPGKDWTHVRVLNERGLQVETFLKDFETDPAMILGTSPPHRLAHPAPPAGLPRAERKRAIDLQDNVAGLFKPGEFAEIVPDLAASDYRAVRMPGSHAEWAFRISGKDIVARKPPGRCKIYLLARIEENAVTNTASTAFVAGVYDNEKKTYPAQAKISLSEMEPGAVGPVPPPGAYRAWYIGTFSPSANRDIFVAPAANPQVKAVWVDRVYLVPDQNAQ